MRKRTVITETIDDIEIELDFEPVFGDTLRQRVGDKIVVAYLVYDSDPKNPMKAWDGEGELFTKPERYGGGSITDDASWGSHLGLTEYGEPDLDIDIVVELANENLRAMIGTNEKFVAWCLDEFEEFSSIEDCFDTVDFDYDRIPLWLHNLRESGLEAAWTTLYNEGKLGTYLAVPVSWCSNNHGPGTASAYTASVDDCDAVWVPGENEIANMTFPEDATYLETLAIAAKYAEGVLNTYVSWCNGDVYGCVVQIHDAETGEQLDGESVWGYYELDWAEKALKEEFFEPTVKRLMEE